MPVIPKPQNPFLMGDPATDAASMATPIGMAAKIPFSFARVAPEKWTPALFAPEEEAVHRTIGRALEYMQGNPFFSRQLSTAKALNQAREVQRMTDDVTGDMRRYGDLLQWLLSKQGGR